MTTKIVKLAAVREEGYPVGVTAPCWFTCPCGRRHKAFVDTIDCACGRRWNEHGYGTSEVGPSAKPEQVILNGIAYHVIAEETLPPRAQANDPKCRRLVTLRRPNGRKERIAKDYGNGRYLVFA